MLQKSGLENKSIGMTTFILNSSKKGKGGSKRGIASNVHLHF